MFGRECYNTRMTLLVLLVEFIALYFFSQWVIKTLFDCFFLLFRSRTVAITVLLVLTFPGTVVHELSHLFTAAILGVPTGKLSLEPTNIRENNIKSGSLMIAETDPFRRYAIGLAPMIGGIIALTAIVYFLPQNTINWITWVLGYLLFSVSISMFSSPADLQGFLPFGITLMVFIGALYYLGLRIALTGTVLSVVDRITTTLINSLEIVLAINVGLLIVAKLLTTVMQRIFRVKIMR